MNFTHLHLHTEYSLLDGIQRIKTLAKELKNQGVSSVALTDHGNMHAAIEFYDILTNPKKYKINEEFNIKPIIGMEAYLHNQKELDDVSSRQRFHLILLAKDEEGYKNLMYLSSMSFIKGFFYKPRINKEILAKHSKGLICSSACLAGEINFHLNPKNESRGARGYEGAKEAALWYKEVFKDDFYLEIMRLGFSEQRAIDDNIIKLSRELDISLVATNDVHYTYKKDAKDQDLFMCIGRAQKLNEPRNSHPSDEMYLKSPQEMEILFADIPEALQNTQEIANKCNLKIKLGDPTPPNFKFALEYAKELNLDLPEPNKEFSLANDIALFEYKSREGLEERLKFIPQEKHKIYKDRLENEIKIINDMKFPGYMLIVADFINEAKKRGIPVGPGRGSAAGSLVAYSLKITDLDPIPYNLLFERFLNPERVSLPDIDVDFCQIRRDEIIDYVIKKYGEYNVAQVATFGKLLAKGVIRDVARVLDMPYSEADKMAKLIPNELKITLDDAFKKEEKIKELIDHNPLAKDIWDYSLRLEGLNRNTGVHAAGVVISNEEIWTKAPLFKQSNSNKKNYLATQYSKDYLEAVDLIKFDFLGLKTLSVINMAKNLIKQRTGNEINWQEIDFNKKEVYELIQSGNTLGIFQIESSGMQALAKKLKPDCFEDIIAMLALYRPGPLNSGMVDDFIKRKHGFKEISYMFDELKEILEPTYGVIVYQEQVMQIVQLVGGFSLGGADLVRRAMGKKDKKILDNLKNEYLDGAKKNGFDVKKSDDLFELILKFAEYGFNKSHSGAYAMITFQTAYLKAFYPAEFMTALLTFEESNEAKVVKYIKEIERLKIAIKKPSINSSDHEFSVNKDGKEIIFGFGAIKGVGSSAIDSLIAERKNSEFKDLNDFVSRVDSFKVNKKVIESLCKAGALDELGVSRNMILSNIDDIITAIKDNSTIKEELENSLFKNTAHSGVDVKFSKQVSEFDLKDILKLEKESIGFYLSGHPLKDYEEKINAIKHTQSFEFEDLKESGQILCIGKIEKLEEKITRNGKKMGILTILDLYSDFEVLAFDDRIKEINLIDDIDKPFGFKLRFSKDEEKINFNLLEIISFEELKDLKFKKINYSKPNYLKKEITLDISLLTKEKINQIYEILSKFNSPKNTHKVDLKILDDDKFYLYETNFCVNENFSINKILSA